MLIINFAMIIGLVIEYGMIKQGMVVVSDVTKRAVYGSMIFVFASIWLVSAGGFIYAAGVFRHSSFDWIFALVLSIVSTLVLVPAKRVLSAFGSTILIGAVFNAVAYALLVYYAQVPAYLPLGIIPVALFEFSVISLKHVMRTTKAIVLAASVVGLFFYATYFPFTLYLFPWSTEPTILLVIVFMGSLAGALAGQRVFSSLASATLGRVTRRSFSEKFKQP
jgi:hypothetical protein